MAAITSWHRYGTKLRHCRPMYSRCTVTVAPHCCGVVSTRHAVNRGQRRLQIPLTYRPTCTVCGLRSVARSDDVAVEWETRHVSTERLAAVAQNTHAATAGAGSGVARIWREEGHKMT